MAAKVCCSLHNCAQALQICCATKTNVTAWLLRCASDNKSYLKGCMVSHVLVLSAQLARCFESASAEQWSENPFRGSQEKQLIAP